MMNPFKQPKYPLELKLLNSKKISLKLHKFICQPDHNNQPTELTPSGLLHPFIPTSKFFVHINLSFFHGINFGLPLICFLGYSDQCHAEVMHT